MGPPPALSTSTLNHLIPPEIVDDVFYNTLKCLCQFENLAHVLEIGSSSGEGSTRAIVRGLTLNPAKPRLHCLEVSQARFAELEAAYERFDFIKCYNMSSVHSSRIPSDQEVRAFYAARTTALQQYGVDTVLGWRADVITYLKDFRELDREGIAYIKESNGIEFFDLVLIDGSEFTGAAELDEVYGAAIIALDDTDSFKCSAARQRLLADPAYELLTEDQTLRHGFSIFSRVDAPCQWRAVKSAIERLARTRKTRWKSTVPARAVRNTLARVQRMF